MTSATIEITEEVRDDTHAIRVDTALLPGMRQGISQIESLVQEIAYLRLQVSGLRQTGNGSSIILERFLAESSSYAESIVDPNNEDTFETIDQPAATREVAQSWQDSSKSNGKHKKLHKMAKSPILSSQDGPSPNTTVSSKSLPKNQSSWNRRARLFRMS